jgi:hypothetical protein
MVGTAGETRTVGNTQLVEHGIQNEHSCIRAHVCPIVQRVYVFPTQAAIELIGSGSYLAVPGYQKSIDVPTAMGYLVPPMDIPGCVALCVRDLAWEHMSFSDTDSLFSKGRKATVFVLQMIKRGLFPLPAFGEEISEQDLQVNGEDIVIHANTLCHNDIIVQVKCDFKGGEADLGGTGNLYLQIAECNPFGIH